VTGEAPGGLPRPKQLLVQTGRVVPRRSAGPGGSQEGVTADLRKLLRSIQVFFPFAQEARFVLGRWWQRWGWPPVEPDLLALPRLA
jgi:hypothetical protein